MSMMRAVGTSLYSVPFLAVLLVAYFQRTDVTATLIRRTSNSIETVVGCSETFVCEAEADTITWTNPIDDQNRTTMRTISVPGESGVLRNYLTITDVTPSDSRQYSCRIQNGQETLTLFAWMSVMNTLVHIVPIEDVDISNRVVGQTLPIRCEITTCQESVSIAILKGSQLVAQRDYYNIDDNYALLDADVIISADTADDYACQVLLPSGNLYTESFRITGTPTGGPSNIEMPNPQQSEDKSTRPTATTRNSSIIHSPQSAVILALLLFITAAKLSLGH